PIETVIVDELIPHVDATFRTIASPDARILEGFSMGGYGTGRLGTKHSGLFCGISILAAGPMQLDFPNAPPDAAVPPDRRAMIFEDVWNSDPASVLADNPWTLAAANAPRLISGGPLIRIAVGGDDTTLPPNVDFHDRLTSLGIPHTFNIYPGIGHSTIPLLTAIGPSNWSFYRDALARRCEALDVDRSGDIDVADIFGFLSAWFAAQPAADFDRSGVRDVADIFAFLSAWFNGCN
ncbi:MAG: hypothetical protein K2Q20_13720, partial [Phycisphaerales bacterium]|nr:hypothetical protein [Phycisphaerales bacterium]